MNSLVAYLSRTRSFNKAMEVKRIRNRLSIGFLICIAIILAVSTYDTYLVFVHQRHIIKMERNPICLFLIRLDPENMTFFLMGKFLGNLGVVCVLAALKWLCFRPYLLVAGLVAGFQIGLLGFLLLSDPVSGLFHFDDLFHPAPDRFRKGLLNLVYHLPLIPIVVLVAFFSLRPLVGRSLNSEIQRQTKPAQATVS
ncbi:MAG: hypothetical protein AAF939_12880 [Planctomycetota bacterium]